ncbi:MAG: hypothetical protein M3393_01850 [Actinomycetota bacterium]|nr:hypothetical protein [Actinomycetota bacterium]
MHIASHLPAVGDVFLDARGDSRALRVSWHTEAGLVVLSLWRDANCAATFRLSIEEVPDLIALLRVGLLQAYDDASSAYARALLGAENSAG